MYNRKSHPIYELFACGSVLFWWHRLFNPNRMNLLFSVKMFKSKADSADSSNCTDSNPITTSNNTTTKGTPHEKKIKLNIDEECDVIGDLIGHYGKWQCMMTILLSLFQVPNTFHIYSPTFQAADKDFWCKRPPSWNTTSVDLWRNISKSADNCNLIDYDWNSINPSNDFEVTFYSILKWISYVYGSFTTGNYLEKYLYV